ncbi:MAG: hypothetical protein ABIQ78_08310 [Dokdonella sp.]
MHDDELIRLLRDLRVGQQEHLALYREIKQRSLGAQQPAIELQRRSARLWNRRRRWCGLDSLHDHLPPIPSHLNECFYS